MSIIRPAVDAAAPEHATDAQRDDYVAAGEARARKPTRFTFANVGTHDGVTEWHVTDAAGAIVATMERQRPTRWAAGVTRGLARDRTAPWEWTADVDGTLLTISDGATVADVKRAVHGKLTAAMKGVPYIARKKRR